MNPGDRRPRVTIATRIYAPEPAAASFRLSALASALTDAGAEVTVVTTTAPGAVQPREVDSRVRVRRRPVLRDASGYVRGYLQYLSFDIPLVFRLLAGPRPSVVVAEPPPTTGMVVRVVCALRRVPYVYYAADVWSDASESMAPKWVVRALRAAESWVLRGAARVIAVTDGVADRVRNLGARRVVVVPNGVDTEVFRPDGPAAPQAPTGPYAVYAGTMSEWQGAEIFVAAMARVLDAVPDATLVFLGSGSAVPLIETAAAALGSDGMRVRILPPVPPQEASAWLRGARAALVSLKPGQGYDFAFPTKVLAGLASGTPVLYAGPGAAAEVIEANRLGLAVEYDVGAVAAALADLLSADPAAADRRRRADWVVNRASIQVVGHRAADIVLKAAGGRP